MFNFGGALQTAIDTIRGMMAKKRDYRKEYDDYHGTAEQKKRRAQRNSARSKAEKAGKVRKGDGKEVDHTGMNRKGDLDNSKVKVVSKKKNRKRQPKRDGSND
jgi:hypothetical protein